MIHHHLKNHAEGRKNCEKGFLFHLKSYFRSRDIQIFVIFFPSFPPFPNTKGQMEVE